MTEATRLSPEITRSIGRELDHVRQQREIVFGKVKKRDIAKKLIWLEEYGELAIPLVAFTFGFAYYDTDATGTVQRREDTSGTNEAFQTHLQVPRIGQMAVVLDPGGAHRFPLCVGVIQSTGYWQGEG